MRERRGLAERGQILVLSALAMTTLMAAIGLAVDVGLYLGDRRELQNSSDAAALAAVAFLPGDAGGAVAAAESWAANNGLGPEEIQSVTDCDDGALDNADVCVRVKVRRDSPAIFFRVLGLFSSEVKARAGAQAGSLAATSGVVPFGVLESAIRYCTYSQITQPTPPAECLTTLKYDVNDTGANIGDLDLDRRGGGGRDLADMIKGGNEDPLCSVNQDPIPAGCATREPPKTGNTTGKIRTAINWRLSEANTTPECDTIAEVVSPDTDGNGRPEIRTGCNPWGGAVVGDIDNDLGTCDNLVWQNDARGSCQIISLPVIDALSAPSGQMTNLKFALFWLLPFANNGQCSGNDCEIKGYFIDAEVSVAGLLGTLDPTITPFVVRKLVE